VVKKYFLQSRKENQKLHCDDDDDDDFGFRESGVISFGNDLLPLDIGKPPRPPLAAAPPP
jgi:hypothetical protein